MTYSGAGISILVPYRPRPGVYARNWNWLAAYWEHQLPGAEVIAADDGGTPFSRSASINAAAAQAHGDVLVNMDADQAVHPASIIIAAAEIRRARMAGQRQWIILAPAINRLKRRASRKVLRDAPGWDAFTGKLAVESRQDGQVTLCAYPREAFDQLGGMDEVFRGWGGEDYAWAATLQLLWSRPLRLSDVAWHLWHPVHGAGWNKKKARENFTRWLYWDDQDGPSDNVHRCAAYDEALNSRDVISMRALNNGAVPEPLPEGAYIPLRMRLGLKPANARYSLNPPTGF